MHKLNEKLRAGKTEIEALKKERAERRGQKYEDPDQLRFDQLNVENMVDPGQAKDAELEAQLQK